MKQAIDLRDPEIPPYVVRFVTVWKQKKHYPDDNLLTFAQCLEFLIAFSYSLSHEDSIYPENGGQSHFNNILRNEEAVLAWDGSEPIDTYFYNVQRVVRMHVLSGRTFNQEIK